MTNYKTIIGNLIAAMGGLIAFLSLETIINSFGATGILLVGVAAVLITLSKRIEQNTKVPRKVLIAASFIMIFLGLKGFVAPFINESTSIIGLIIAGSLITFADSLAEQINQIFGGK